MYFHRRRAGLGVGVLSPRGWIALMHSLFCRHCQGDEFCSTIFSLTSAFHSKSLFSSFKDGNWLPFFLTLESSSVRKGPKNLNLLNIESPSLELAPGGVWSRECRQTISGATGAWTTTNTTSLAKENSTEKLLDSNMYRISWLNQYFAKCILFQNLTEIWPMGAAEWATRLSFPFISYSVIKTNCECSQKFVNPPNIGIFRFALILVFFSIFCSRPINKGTFLKKTPFCDVIINSH